MNINKNRFQKKKRYASIFSFLVIFYLIFPISFNFAQEIKIKVIAKKAYVRLEPKPTSAIVSTISAGLIVTHIRKTGEWYFVELSTNEKGDVIAGYIHQSQVEKIYSEKKQEEIFEEKEETKAPAKEKNKISITSEAEEKNEKSNEIAEIFLIRDTSSADKFQKISVSLDSEKLPKIQAGEYTKLKVAADKYNREHSVVVSFPKLILLDSINISKKFSAEKI